MPTIDQLEQIRSQLHDRLAQTGDLRRGTVGTTYRRCGKPNCACADPQHPGHGPRHRLTRSVGGKTEAIDLHTDAEVAKARREVANYRHFTGLVEDIVEVNEQICEARPIGEAAATPPAGTGGERGGSSGTSRRSSRRR